MKNKVTINNENFIFVDGVKIGKWLPETNEIQFFDKNKARSEKRGTCFVTIDISTLFILLKGDGVPCSCSKLTKIKN